MCLHSLAHQLFIFEGQTWHYFPQGRPSLKTPAPLPAMALLPPLTTVICLTCRRWPQTASGCWNHSSVQFSLSVVSDSLWPHGLQHTRPPCPSPTPWVYLNSCPLSWWCHPNISSSVIPFSACLQSFPASRSFQMSQFFTSGGQSIGVSASASVLPMNIQDWFSLRWTGWISLQSKGLSRVSSNTKFKSINPSALSFLYSPTLTSIYDYWKNHSLDWMDLCWQSNVSDF